MKIYVKAKITAIENEGTIKYKSDGKTSEVATLILDVGDSDFICCNCFGRDRIAVCKEKMKAGVKAELVINVLGKVKKSERLDKIMYDNDLSLKWILN